MSGLPHGLGEEVTTAEICRIESDFQTHVARGQAGMALFLQKVLVPLSVSDPWTHRSPQKPQASGDWMGQCLAIQDQL